MPGSFVSTSACADVDPAIDEEVRALPIAECSKVNTDIPSAYTTITAICANVAQFMPAIEAGAAIWNAAVVVNLGRYNSAMMRAHTEFLIASEPAPSIMPLVERASLARQRLHTDVRACIDYGLIPREALVLGAPQAHHALATDLLVLSTLVVKYWSNIQGKTPLTLENAADAKAIANELFAALAKEKEQTETLAEANVRRRAAFTLCMRALRETRRAIQAIRYHEDDAEELLPSVFDFAGKAQAKPQTKQSEGAGDGDPTTDVSDDAPTEPMAPNPVSPAPVDAKPVVVPARPGFPGGNPFGDR